MRLVWLEALVALAERESFTEAAKAIGKDQSSVSRYIDQLQRWLGKALIASHSPVTLTTEGASFLPIARQVIALLNGSRNENQRASVPVDPRSIRIS